VMDHLKATANQRHTPPFNCSECGRESQSYLNLLKHFIPNHLGHVAASKGFKNRFQRPEPTLTTEERQEPNATGIR
jgi:hypothetical protein